MAVYRNVHISFWTDTKVVDDFTPEDKYFYLYLITNSHTNLLGCYEISINQMASDTGYNKSTIERLIDRFQNIHKIAIYSNDTKEMIVLNWYKYNWTNSPKLDKALTSALEKVKNSNFRQYLNDLINGNDTVSIPYAYPMHTTDTDTDTVPDTITDSIYITILDYWNNKVDMYRTNKFKVPKHNKVTPSMEKSLDKAIKLYGFNYITLAIERYMVIGNDETYYFNYVWTLEEFVKQFNALPEFLDEGGKWVNYISSRSGQKKQEQQALNQITTEDMRKDGWIK